MGRASLRLRYVLLSLGLGGQSLPVAAAKKLKVQRGTPRRPEKAIVGSSPALLKCLAQARRLAPRRLPVLILGPTGSGKEGIAGLMAQESGRCGDFIPINCAALPEHLIESELFGHERGAFTGARERRLGLFESAEGGTLLLDEIGEMPLSLQSKLLRVLEVKAIRRVGGVHEIPVDVRILASTHCDLLKMAKEGRFREDLYYRLSQGRVVVPPLRDRGSDIETLARHFLSELSQREGLPQPRLSRRSGLVLRQHDWPGNARELKALMAHLMIGEGIRRIDAEHIWRALDLGEETGSLSGKVEIPTLSERVVEALSEVGWVSAVVLRQRLGVSKGSLQRCLRTLVEERRISIRGQGRGRVYGPKAGEAESSTQRPVLEEGPRSGEPRAAIVKLAGGTRAFKRGDVVECLGLTPRTASRLLGELVGAGSLVREGRGRGVVYRLAT